MLDLLIIGAGLTGLSAAMRAVEAGLQVKIIAKGQGALHWSAATVDVLGYPTGAKTPVQDPWAAANADLPAAHPYRQLGVERVQQAVQTFRGWTEQVGVPYVGGDEPGQNFPLPSPVGAARPVYLAPVAQRAGDLRRRQPMVIVGFAGMRDFYPQLLADNLAAQGQQVRAAQLPISTLTDRRDANTVHLAQALDDPARQQLLMAATKQVCRPGERIGLPAILGLHAHAQVMATLREGLGTDVFEIPTLSPSVPGIRLTTALRYALESRGAHVEIGMEAISFHAEEKIIQWVETATSARPLKHRARQFLLTTGGVLGGGFSSDHTGHFWEVVFGLPLTVPQDRSKWFRPLFFDAVGHPVFHGGVATNARLQPVDLQGDVVYTNLRAAGGLLAGADPIQERSLEGIGIATGIAAIESML